MLDAEELELAMKFLRRRAEQPDEDLVLAYAEVYGDVVYEAAPPSSTESNK